MKIGTTQEYYQNGTLHKTLIIIEDMGKQKDREFVFSPQLIDEQ